MVQTIVPTKKKASGRRVVVWLKELGEVWYMLCKSAQAVIQFSSIPLAMYEGQYTAAGWLFVSDSGVKGGSPDSQSTKG